MMLINKFAAEIENNDLTSIIPLIKDLDDRLTRVEHDIIDLKVVLSQGSNNNVEIFVGESETDKFDSLLENMSDSASHIKEAKDFLKNMVAKDNRELFKKTPVALSVQGMLPTLNNTLNHGESAQKFLTELSTENLLSIFSQQNIAKNNKFLDAFLTSLPSVSSELNPKEESLIEESINSRIELSVDSKKKKTSKSKIKKTLSKKVNVSKSKSKNSSTRVLSRKLVMDHSPQGMEFYFSTGVVVKSIHELYVYLNSSQESVFYEHVTELKNDFAEWIINALEYKRFGNLVRSTKSREDCLELLKNVCA